MQSPQRTVNLKKDSQEEKPTVIPQQRVAQKPKTKKITAPKENKSLDKIYGGDGDLKAIERSKENNILPFFKQLFFIFIIGAIAFFIFSYISDNKKEGVDTAQEKANAWYLIRLVNDDVYYGKIKDESSDPVILESVYYNYDQLTDENKELSEVGNLRLVKRGQETHGPSGDMEIYKEKILFKERLSDNSPVLEAIINNENK